MGVGVRSSRSFDTILALLANRLDEAERQLSSAAAYGKDLIALAQHLGVGPVVARRLLALPKEAMPSELREIASHWLRRHAGTVALSLVELLWVVRLLEDETGIPCLPLKGPTLSLQLYGDVAARQSGDVDVLVPERQAAQACRLLAERGYRAVNPSAVASDGTPTPEYLRRRHNLVLRNPKGDCVLELHWRLNELEQLAPWGFATLLDNTETVEVGYIRVRALTGASLLAYLGVHAVNSRWSSLKWLYDLAYVAERYGDSAMDEGYRLAREAGFGRMLDAGLGLSLVLNGRDSCSWGLPRYSNPVTWRRDIRRLQSALVREGEPKTLGKRVEEHWGRLCLLDRWPMRAAMFERMLQNVIAAR